MGEAAAQHAQLAAKLRGEIGAAAQQATAAVAAAQRAKAVEVEHAKQRAAEELAEAAQRASEEMREVAHRERVSVRRLETERDAERTQHHAVAFRLDAMEKTLAVSEARAAATGKALAAAQTQLGEAGQVVRDAESTARSGKGEVVAAQQKLVRFQMRVLTHFDTQAVWVW